MLDENNILPAIVQKKVQLLHGQGAELYETKFENGRRIKYFDMVPEIQKFLEDWDYRKYLLEINTEYHSAGGYAS